MMQALKAAAPDNFCFRIMRLPKGSKDHSKFIVDNRRRGLRLLAKKMLLKTLFSRPDKMASSGPFNSTCN